MSSRFDNVMLEYLLYSFLLLFAIFLLFRPEARWEPSLSNGIIGGSISGFVAGMLGTGGAIRGLTMSAFALSIQGFVATSAAIDLGVDLARSVVYYGEGYMVKEIWIYIPFLLFVSIIGSYIGKYILQFLNPDNFRRFSLGSIVIIAIAGWVRLIWFSAGSLLF